MSDYQENQLSASDSMPVSPSEIAPEPAPVKKPAGCLVVFLGFMLALSLVTGIFLVNLRLTFFSPTFWKNWLVKSEAYERVGEVFLPNIFSLTTPAADTVVSSEVTADLPSEDVAQASEDYFSPAVEREIVVLLQDSISPYWLEQQSKNAIDSFFRWTQGQEQNLRIVFDLRDLQGPFTEGFLNIAETRFNEMPICATVTDPEKYDLESADCRPAGVEFATLREEFLRDYPQSVEGGYFPEEYIVDEAVFLNLWQSGDKEFAGINQDVSNLFANPPRLYQILMVWLVVTLIFIGVFAALLFYIYRRSWQAGTKVVGIVALLTAVIIFVFSLLIYAGAGSMGKPLGLTSSGQNSLDVTSPAITGTQSLLISDFVLPLLSGFLKAAVLNVIYISAAIMAVAIVLLIASKYGSTRQVVSYDSKEWEQK
jgi:hypothetical protein